MERRTLFKGIAASSLAAGVTHAATTSPSREAGLMPGQKLPPLPLLTEPGELRGEMLYRRFGHTGETVSAIGFGGSHFAKPGITEAESTRLCHAAIDRGITYMDNAWDYNKGDSEVRMGNALAQGGYRNKVFLMTKVDGRTRLTAQQQLEQSLQRLQTDHIDLWQFHEILRYDDPDRIFAAGGALQTALDAKRAGKIRFIGFTGHKDPWIHVQMMELARMHGFHFDAVLMPSNVMDAHFRSFARIAMPMAIRDGIAVQTMKCFGGSDGVILKSNTGITPIECLHYVLNLPTSVVITGIDNDRALNQAFEAAKSFRPMTPEQVAAITSKSVEQAATGTYELFKTSSHFDGTAQHPEWLGGDSAEIEQLAPKGGG